MSEIADQKRTITHAQAVALVRALFEVEGGSENYDGDECNAMFLTALRSVFPDLPYGGDCATSRRLTSELNPQDEIDSRYIQGRIQLGEILCAVGEALKNVTLRKPF